MYYIGITELKKVYTAWASIMKNNQEHLILLDGFAGDSDLGLTMTDGFAAAKEFAKSYEGNDIGELLYVTGKAILSKAPSSLGTLLGGGFLEAAKEFKGKSSIEFSKIYLLFEAIERSIMARGQTKVGDKTFLDGLHPAIEVLKQINESSDIKQMLLKTENAANEGSRATVGMVAKHGRMAIRGEESRVLIDPGSVVAALMVEAFSKTLISLL